MLGGALAQPAAGRDLAGHRDASGVLNDEGGALRQPGPVGQRQQPVPQLLSGSVAASSASVITARRTDRVAPSCSTVAARRSK